MKKHFIFKFKYPKIFLLILFIILSYIIFRNPDVSSFISNLGSWGYIGVFIAGILFAFGFTAPFAVGFFISLNPSNIWLSAIIGGLGALVSDLFIFKFIRISFEDEFKSLERTKTFRNIEKIFEKEFSKKIKIYLMYAVIGFFITSPLPDEIGVMMIAGLTKIKTNILSILSFILNTIGILILLLI